MLNREIFKLSHSSLLIFFEDFLKSLTEKEEELLVCTLAESAIAAV